MVEDSDIYDFCLRVSASWCAYEQVLESLGKKIDDHILEYHDRNNDIFTSELYKDYFKEHYNRLKNGENKGS